jgi:hypothetical protein
MSNPVAHPGPHRFGRLGTCFQCSPASTAIGDKHRFGIRIKEFFSFSFFFFFFQIDTDRYKLSGQVFFLSFVQQFGNEITFWWPARVNAEALGNNNPSILALKAKRQKKLEPKYRGRENNTHEVSPRFREIFNVKLWPNDCRKCFKVRALKMPTVVV